MVPCRLRRFCANSLDGLFGTLLAFGGIVVYLLVAGVSSEDDTAITAALSSWTVDSVENLGPVRGVILALLSLGLGYTLLEVLFPASPGKLLLNIAVARADGTPSDWTVRLVRWFWKYLSEVLFFMSIALLSQKLLNGVGVARVVGAIGLLLIFGSSGRTLWDRLSGTTVIHRGELAEAQAEPVQLRRDRSTAPDPNDLFKPRW